MIGTARASVLLSACISLCNKTETRWKEARGRGRGRTERGVIFVGRRDHFQPLRRPVLELKTTRTVWGRLFPGEQKTTGRPRREKKPWKEQTAKTRRLARETARSPSGGTRVPPVARRIGSRAKRSGTKGRINSTSKRAGNPLIRANHSFRAPPGNVPAVTNKRGIEYKTVSALETFPPRRLARERSGEQNEWRAGWVQGV